MVTPLTILMLSGPPKSDLSFEKGLVPAGGWRWFHPDHDEDDVSAEEFPAPRTPGVPFTDADRGRLERLRPGRKVTAVLRIDLRGRPVWGLVLQRR